MNRADAEVIVRETAAVRHAALTRDDIIGALGGLSALNGRTFDAELVAGELQSPPAAQLSRGAPFRCDNGPAAKCREHPEVRRERGRQAVLDLPFLLLFAASVLSYGVMVTIALRPVAVIIALSLAVAPIFRSKLNEQPLLAAQRSLGHGVRLGSSRVSRACGRRTSWPDFSPERVYMTSADRRVVRR